MPALSAKMVIARGSRRNYALRTARDAVVRIDRLERPFRSALERGRAEINFLQFVASHTRSLELASSFEFNISKVVTQAFARIEKINPRARLRIALLAMNNHRLAAQALPYVHRNIHFIRKLSVRMEALDFCVQTLSHHIESVPEDERLQQALLRQWGVALDALSLGRQGEVVAYFRNSHSDAFRRAAIEKRKELMRAPIVPRRIPRITDTHNPRHK